MSLENLRRLIALSSVTALAAVAAGCGEVTAEVGKCTNSDPELMVQVVAIEIVECDDDAATTKLVKETKDTAECEKGRLTVELDGEKKIFCTEPLSGS